MANAVLEATKSKLKAKSNSNHGLLAPDGTANRAKRMKFIELCATTSNSLADNYINAGYEPATRKSAGVAASILSRRPEVKDAIDTLRAKKVALSVKKAGLSLEEANAWLRDLVMTPPSQIGPDSPLANGVKITQFGHEIKIPDKLGGIKLAMELQGLGGQSAQANPFGGMALQVVVNNGPTQASARVIDVTTDE